MSNRFQQLLTKRLSLPFSARIEESVRSFSPAEKAIFIVFVALLIFGTVGLLAKVNGLFLVERPAHGGVLTEGIVGTPRFVNPLLALSDADRDLSALIYSGLLRSTPQGKLVPDLAERFEISPDGLSYTFFLRKDAEFHDRTPVTADDVLFTIQRAQDPMLKSPRRANWEGVTAEKIDAETVRLTLKQSFAPFLLNTTLGILPKHLWENKDAEQFPFSPRNITAVGSGPFALTSVTNDSSGLPSIMTLHAFKKYALGMPFLATLIIRFYPNEAALLSAESRREVESMDGLTPSAAAKLAARGARLLKTPLPRVFSVFFNQNQAPILADREVRQALLLATDKEALVNSVLQGFGVPIDSPVPPLLFETAAAPRSEELFDLRLARANALLDKAMWKRNPATGIREKTKGKVVQPLAFSLATSQIPELKESAEMLAKMWKEIGASVEVQIFETGDLNQNVIRPRKFDALLFGEIVGHDLDLFAFWHSSQRNDPGLNVSGYANAKVDRWLESARRSTDEENRSAAYVSAIEAIRTDAPAIFLYSPEFMYLLPQKIHGFTAGRVAIPSERFLGIEQWYIQTKKVWDLSAH